MSPEDWARIKHLFADLESLSVEARRARLAASGESVKVLEQVQRLLDAADEAGTKFLTPHEDCPNDVAGQMLGPFRLIRLLGEGGMGRVFLAERVDVGGLVAVKLLRERLAGAGLMQRFETEQRILARLDHPNIARLLQVGRTADGAPWLAMEYVEGRSLNEAIHALGVRDRVRLFLSVLDALDYAHRQLVVHRDLKPSNVIVDMRGEPKLLDFGIAKRLDSNATELTELGSGPRTPGYAAPEQIRDEPITVATDVYAMGVLIYEGLCGERPFDGRGLELQTAILRGLPVLPSNRVAEPLRGQLKGDLDAIVLQAMQVDHARRYPSAGALASDLRAYLERQPVRAQAQTWTYRTGKFLRRNLIPVAVATVLAMLVGLAFLRENMLRQAAALETEKSRQMSDFMLDLFDAGNALNPSFRLTKDATVLDLMARGVERVDERDLPAEIRAELMHKFGEVYWGLSDYGLAESMFRRAIELRRKELGQHTDTAESHLMLGRVFERSGRYRESFEASEVAYRMRLRTLGANHVDTIRAHHRMGVSLMLLNDLEAAKRTFDDVIPAFTRLLPGTELPLANSLTVRGQIRRRQGDSQGALDDCEQVLALRKRVLPAGHSLFGEALLNIAAAHYQVGDMGKARSNMEAALRIDEGNFSGDHLDLVADYQWLALSLIGDGDAEAARPVVEKGLAMAQRLHDRHPNIVMLDRMRQAHAVLLRAEGRLVEALALQDEVLASRLATLAPTDMHTMFARAVLADLLVQLGDARASAALEAAVASWLHEPMYNELELATALYRATASGRCEWLDHDWPQRMAPAVAAAVERGRLGCASR